MMYCVEILYKNQPAFFTRVDANCTEVAKANAVSMAKRSGFTGKVKKITVRREQ